MPLPRGHEEVWPLCPHHCIFSITAPWKGRDKKGYILPERDTRGHKNKDFHEAGWFLVRRRTARSLSIPMPRGNQHGVGRGRHWSHPSCRLGAARPQDPGMDSLDALCNRGCSRAYVGPRGGWLSSFVLFCFLTKLNILLS